MQLNHQKYEGIEMAGQVFVNFTVLSSQQRLHLPIHC